MSIDSPRGWIGKRRNSEVGKARALIHVRETLLTLRERRSGAWCGSVCALPHFRSVCSRRSHETSPGRLLAKVSPVIFRAWSNFRPTDFPHLSFPRKTPLGFISFIVEKKNIHALVTALKRGERAGREFRRVFARHTHGLCFLYLFLIFFFFFHICFRHLRLRGLSWILGEGAAETACGKVSYARTNIMQRGNSCIDYRG